VLEVKLDRVLAKLQRKVTPFTERQLDQFQTQSGFEDVKELGQHLKTLKKEQLKNYFEEKEAFWEYLDHQKSPKPYGGTLIYEGEDFVNEEKRVYDKKLQPKDYIESFVDFVKNNYNQIEALKIVCTKPSSLTRKDLKELKYTLDEKGYTKSQLNTAYAETTNNEIVADIIAHVRTAGLGSDLVAHDERIKAAIQKLKNQHKFNSIQLKWLDRIEKQLLEQNVITKQDLNRSPFDEFGGLKKIDKAFQNQTEALLAELNEYLYA